MQIRAHSTLNPPSSLDNKTKINFQTFSIMKKENKNQILTNLASRDYGSQNVSEMPLQVGQVLTIVPVMDKEPEKCFIHTVSTVIDGVSRQYEVVETKEGYTIGLKHLLRNHNGLELGRGTKAEVLGKFLDMIPDTGLSIRISEILKVDSSFGTGKQTYYKFQKA